MNSNPANRAAGADAAPQLGCDEQDGQPIAAVAGTIYHALADLVAAHPEISSPDRLLNYCALFLHFHPGPGCILIHQPDEFHKRYHDSLTRPVLASLPESEWIAPPEPGWQPSTEPPPEQEDDLVDEQEDDGEAAPPYQYVEDVTTLADLDRYDVSEIAMPRIEGDRLVFYAEEPRYGVPYRVEAPWPAGAEGEVKFKLLPIANG